MNAEIAEKVEVPPYRINWKILIGFCVLAGLTLLLCQLEYKHTIAPDAGVVMNLPVHVGKFTGEDQEISEGEKVILPKGTEFAKKGYSDAAGEIINCQIVLSGGDKRSIHRPEICLPGQGWTISSQRTVEVPLRSGTDLGVRRLDLVRQVEVSGGHRPLHMVFLYWFVGNQFTTPDHRERILKTNLDMLLYSKAHRWAYVIVSAPVLEGFKSNGKNEAQTFAMLSDFLRDIVPTFMKTEMPVAIPTESKK